jgi:Flp pilus assembly protein TadG
MWALVLFKLRSHKSQRGAAALEFALVFPVLLLLLIGIVDFGMLMGAQTQVANAAREGGRAGALTGMQSEAEAAAKAAIAGMPGATNAGTKVAVACTKPNGDSCSMADTTADTGSTVTVTITYVHTWLSPAILSLAPTITLQGQSKMRIEA